MNLKANCVRVVATIAALRPLAVAAAPLAARLVFGHGFLLAGWGKLSNLDATTGYFDGLGLPLPGVHAVLVGFAEALGGALLLIGLKAKPAAFVLTIVMIGALLTGDRSNVIAAFSAPHEASLAKSQAALFLTPLLWLMAYGAGPFSLDRR